MANVGNISRWIKNVLDVNTEIGTYTSVDGNVDPAIAIGNIPDNVDVDGIEFVIVSLFPSLSYSITTNHFNHRKEEWNVDIVNHSDDDVLFITVIDKLLKSKVPFRTTGNFIPISDPFKQLPRYRLNICTSDAYKVTL